MAIYQESLHDARSKKCKKNRKQYWLVAKWEQDNHINLTHMTYFVELSPFWETADHLDGQETSEILSHLRHKHNRAFYCFILHNP